jgi:hypothetical protein
MSVIGKREADMAGRLKLERKMHLADDAKGTWACWAILVGRQPAEGERANVMDWAGWA